MESYTCQYLGHSGFTVNVCVSVQQVKARTASELQEGCEDGTETPPKPAQFTLTLTSSPVPGHFSVGGQAPAHRC